MSCSLCITGYQLFLLTSKCKCNHCKYLILNRVWEMAKGEVNAQSLRQCCLVWLLPCSVQPRSCQAEQLENVVVNFTEDITKCNGSSAQGRCAYAEDKVLEEGRETIEKYPSLCLAALEQSSGS